MNVIQVRTALKKTDVPSGTLNKIAGVKGPLKALTQYAESLNIPLNTEVAPAMMKKNIQGMVNAFTAKIAETMRNGAKFGNTIEGKMLYAEMQNIAKADIQTIANRMTSEINLYAESMMAGEYHPFQLALLPHVYLETIANNSRFLMPVKEYVSEQLPPRKILVRQLVIDGVKYDFPHCLKDPEVMRKMRNVGSEAFEFTISTPFDATFNIFEKSSKGKKGEDSLVPQLDIVKVKYADAGTSADEVVVTKASSILPDANNYTMGRLFKTVKSDKPTATTTAQIAAEINFASGDVKLLADSTVKEITFKCYMSGAYNRKSASIDIETKPIIQMIKNRINMIFDYDPGAMQNFLSLENIDGVLEGQSIMFDAMIAAKDQFAFDTLNGVMEDLKSESAANVNFEMLDRGYWEDTHYPKPGVDSGFRPTSPEQWDIEELGRRMKNLHTKLATKFRSTAGMQYNWWASPVNVQRFIRSTPIVSKSEEYGGMMNDYQVYALQVAGAVAKMVETERAQDEDGIKCVPYSNMEQQPTFEFQQGPHALYTDGTFRHPARPHMPAIAYFDYFDCNYVFAVLGQIKIDDSGDWTYSSMR